MDAVVFSWSGAFRDRFDEREDRIRSFMDTIRETDVEIGIVTSGEIESVSGGAAMDFVIPHVDDLREVLASLRSRYDKVFFVSDVKAELATANQSGAFTVGLASSENGAEELSGVGPNYVLESLDELEGVLALEDLG